MKRFLTALVLLAVFTGWSDAFSCYDCNSENQPGCGDPFNSAGIGTTSCEHCLKSHYVGSVYRYSREGSGVRRGCPSDVSMCWVRAKREVMCCDGDYCNSAPSLRPGTLQMILLLLAVHILFKRKTFLVVLLFLTIFIGWSDAFTCYECDSLHHPGCGDPFSSAGLSTTHCSHGCSKNKHVGTNFLFPASTYIKGTKRVTRGCKWEDAKCYKSGAIKQSCCNGDFCNSAPLLKPGTLLILVLPALRYAFFP